MGFFVDHIVYIVHVHLVLMILYLHIYHGYNILVSAHHCTNPKYFHPIVNKQKRQKKLIMINVLIQGYIYIYTYLLYNISLTVIAIHNQF